ncbi:hypothetical protein Tco_0853919 [Tanacetum coccineum]
MIIDKGDASSDTLHKRAKVVKSIQEVDKLCAMEASQKAKIKWAIEGDENSKYYHGILNKKRNQLSIRGVLVEGDLVENPNMVKNEFLNHFKNRSDRPKSVRRMLNMEFPHHLNSMQQLDLEAEVSKIVTGHVTQVTSEFNQKLETVNTILDGILSQMHFLVNDLARLNGGEGTSRFSRLGKLEFPKFHGDDVQGWMFRVKQFFAIDNVDEEDKVKIVSIHFYDRALAWHLQFIKAHDETCNNAHFQVILRQSIFDYLF